jgi:hypothetical protein
VKDTLVADSNPVSPPGEKDLGALRRSASLHGSMKPGGVHNFGILSNVELRDRGGRVANRRAKNELIWKIEFLKDENDMLRKRVPSSSCGENSRGKLQNVVVHCRDEPMSVLMPRDA